MTETTQLRQDRPLVTFALFTYNQEQFVREAVEAAFAQTYEPLEIVLSDDCSSDGTYSILQEMVNAYEGPHDARCQQTPENIGTVAHVMDVASQSKGELIILASGDDISKPNRAFELEASWSETGAWGLHSQYDEIDEFGQTKRLDVRSMYLLEPEYRLRKYFLSKDGEVDIVHGATSAYDKRLFDIMQKEKLPYILSEDGFFSLILNLINRKVEFLSESLVLYRSHSNSLTNGVIPAQKLTTGDIYREISRSELYAQSCSNRAEFLLNYREKNPNAGLRRINKTEIKRDICTFKAVASWFRMPVSQRFHLITAGGKTVSKKWAIPRLFGPKIFTLLKISVYRVQSFRRR